MRRYNALVTLLLWLVFIAIGSTATATSVSSFSPRASTSTSVARNVGEGPFQWDPKPNPDSVVLAGNARFTVLTEQLIRLEWNAQRQFVDFPTMIALRRNLPRPAYQATIKDSTLTLITKYVTITYKFGTDIDTEPSFNTHNLNVSIMYYVTVQGVSTQKTVQWNLINKEDTIGNLKGTVRTLDGNSGETDINLDCKDYGNAGSQHCTYGLISRNGYAVVDDSNGPSFDRNDSPLLDNGTWPWFNSYSWSQPAAAQCTIVDAEKRDCGYNGITGAQCRRKGCCWSGNGEHRHEQEHEAVHDASFGIPTCYYGNRATQDLYLFAHGHNYRQALKEFTAISGPIPLPPRYIFGIFFSRYWAYSASESKQIVREYVEHGVPLDVFVSDMDFHLTAYKLASQGAVDQAGEQLKWTGFTFDEHLFSDHAGFLAWCKQLGLKNTLNVHPAGGIEPWEESYSAMAIANGIDPQTQKYVPFNATSKLYISTWFEKTMLPLAKSGVDLWWLDWQQGEDWNSLVSPPGLNPTIALNYQFYTDPFHWQSTLTRPALLHRWGGLGNHRYQSGFSGDVNPGWTSLAWQHYFTPTASNVLYVHWSHDLGGHTAPTAPELYVRWLQWGAVSPIFRTHCTKNADNDRRIWTYPWSVYNQLKRFSKLRQTLVPYVYTNARIAYDTAIGGVVPLYYNHPEDDEAYTFDHEFYFGEHVIVAPISRPISNLTGMVEWSWWLPQGTFVNMFTGQIYSGPATFMDNFTLAEMPIFARAGSIIPMLPEDTPSVGQSQLVPTRLKWVAFVAGAAQGAGRVYDDHGNNVEYASGNYMWSNVTYNVSGSNMNVLTFSIAAAAGMVFSSFPNARSYQIVLKGVLPATAVKVNGQAASVPVLYNELLAPSVLSVPTYSYDGDSLSVVINTPPLPTAQSCDIVVTLAGSIASLPTYGFEGRLVRYNTAKQTIDNLWGTQQTVYQDDYPNTLTAGQLGEKITGGSPQSAAAIIATLSSTYAAAACVEMRNLTQNSKIAPSLQSQLVAQLC